MQEKTALVAASSPKGAANSYCSRLIAAHDDEGNPIFNTVRASESCKACLAAGISETCNHKALSRSKNKSTRKMKATAALYQDGDYDTMMEEMYGLESNSKGGIIPDSAVKTFLENIKTLLHRPRCVYISIDPGGGGKGSQMGVIVAAELNTAASGVKIDLLLVAGVPCHRSSGWEVEKATSEAVLDFVRTHPLLSQLPIIVMLEAAPGLAASNISRHLDDYAMRNRMKESLIYMRECQDNAIGVLKSKKLNVDYRYCLEFVLKYDLMCCDSNVKTLHPTNPPRKEVERLGEMMRSYHRDEKTGIINSKLDGAPDDILSALNQMLYWGNVFWTTAKYLPVRADIVRRSQCDFQFPTNGSFRPKNVKL